MSVTKRKTSRGTTSCYHYDFSYNGNRYRGVCKECTTERAALTYEKEKRKLVIELASQKSAAALVENFRQELTGGNTVLLSEAYSLYEAKPRPKKAGSERAKQNRRMWEDFIGFMQGNYPDIQTLVEVSKHHAEEYISELRTRGRYIKTKKFHAKHFNKEVSYNSNDLLSPTTANQYLKHCKSVFNWLADDAGLISNPFNLPLQKATPESREAFTLDELRLIGKNMTGFVRPIFIIGICSGLSEGDICLLKWSEVHDGWITRKRKKTGALLDIPILPPLADFLAEQSQITGDKEYVLPEHAKMYQSNSSGISYRFKSFLENLGISTTKKAEGSNRAVSIKDVHSLRHTFAYMAGVYQIPLPVVQSVLGHMSPEMTKHYQAHADRQAKEKYLLQLPNFLNSSQVLPVSNSRQKLLEIVESLNENEVEKVLQFCSNLSN